MSVLIATIAAMAAAGVFVQSNTPALSREYAEINGAVHKGSGR